MSLLSHWIPAFVLTVAIELPIYAALLRPWCRPVEVVGICLLANLVTHPALWFGLRLVHSSGWIWGVTFLAAEAGIVLAEWAVLGLVLRGRGAGRVDLAAAAGLANLTSAGVGLLLQLR